MCKGVYLLMPFKVLIELHRIYSSLGFFPVWLTWVLFHVSGNRPSIAISDLDVRFQGTEARLRTSQWSLFARPLPPHLPHPGNSSQLSSLLPKWHFSLGRHPCRDAHTHRIWPKIPSRSPGVIHLTLPSPPVTGPPHSLHSLHCPFTSGPRYTQTSCCSHYSQECSPHKRSPRPF